MDNIYKKAQDAADLGDQHVTENEILRLRARDMRREEGNTRYISGWYGVRGGSSRRAYVCYLCDTWIDTESAQWRQTKHAERAIEEHRQMHLAEPDQLKYERLCGLD